MSKKKRPEYVKNVCQKTFLLHQKQPLFLFYYFHIHAIILLSFHFINHVKTFIKILRLLLDTISPTKYILVNLLLLNSTFSIMLLFTIFPFITTEIRIKVG